MGVELRGSGGEETAAGEDTPLDVGEELLAQHLELSSGVAACAAGATTSASKIASAVSIAASWSSSFDPKWA